MGLETVELILLAEEQFHIEVTDEAAQSVATVAEFAGLICQLTRQQGKAVSEADVSDWLVNTLVVEFGVNPNNIHSEARFVQDLGLD